MLKMKLARIVLIMAALVTAINARADYGIGLENLKTKNYKAALREFTESSQAGDIRATYQLGKLYLSGLGVKKDVNRAVEYFDSAFSAYQEQLDRSRSKNLKTAESQSLIGKLVCRNGILAYSWGYKNFNGSFDASVNDGQVSGNIEQISKDGSNIQIRISGWASNEIASKSDGINIYGTPILDREIQATPGSLIWDKANKWVFCN